MKSSGYSETCVGQTDIYAQGFREPFLTYRSRATRFQLERRDSTGLFFNGSPLKTRGVPQIAQALNSSDISIRTKEVLHRTRSKNEYIALYNRRARVASVGGRFFSEVPISLRGRNQQSGIHFYHRDSLRVRTSLPLNDSTSLKQTSRSSSR